MTLEEQVEFILKKVDILEEDLKGLQLQIDLMADRVYDYTNEYEIEL